jgi:hypothetical protein
LIVSLPQGLCLVGSSPAPQGNFRLKPLPDGTFQDSGKSLT